MGRTGSNVWTSISLLLCVGGMVLMLTEADARHLATVHFGSHYYVVDDYHGSLYATRTIGKGFWIDQWDDLNGFFCGVKRTSTYWHSITFAVPIWPIIVVSAILPIQKARR